MNFLKSSVTCACYLIVGFVAFFVEYLLGYKDGFYEMSKNLLKN